MKVLLTGAPSPLGRRVYQQLVSDGHEVVVLIRPEEQAAWSGPRPDVAFIEADYVTPERYGPAIAGCEVLIHLGDICQAEDHEFIRVNLKGTQGLLHAFSAWGSPRLMVLLSTALLDLPSPDDPDAPTERFGSAWLATRAGAEARVAHWARRTGVETVVLRAGHPFGAAGIDGPLSGWLDQSAASAESDGKLALDGADTPLPFVQVDELADAITRRVQGEAMPGERRLVAKLSRAEAVGLLGTLRETHDLLCRRTERSPSLTTQKGSLGRRLLSTLSPGRALPGTAAFLRRAPVKGPNPAWVERYGQRSLGDVVDALVGGAC